MRRERSRRGLLISERESDGLEMSEDGSGMLAAFEFVRDAYKTASRMLLAADALMTDRQLSAYPWHGIWPSRSNYLSKVDWLPTAVFRHYYSEPQKDREVITLAAVFFSADERKIAEPLCIGSRMYVTAVESNDVYRWGIVQRWAPRAAPPDGAVRRLASSGIAFGNDSERRKFDDGVVGQTLATVAVPLLGIRSPSELERQIIDPLLAFTFSVAPSTIGRAASEADKQ